jgi:hypothetical protein
VEYVIVEFAERREVLVDESSVGDNMTNAGDYRILMVTEGVHTLGLGGAKNYMPSAQTVVIDGTSPINPLRVVFQKKG